jgi:hypothetical protein
MLISPSASFVSATPCPVKVETKSVRDMLALGEELAEIDLLVVPLIGNGFDALDLIEALGATVFMGHIRVVASPLANRDAVLAELRCHAEPLGLRVDLIECL